MHPDRQTSTYSEQPAESTEKGKEDLSDVQSSRLTMISNVGTKITGNRWILIMATEVVEFPDFKQPPKKQKNETSSVFTRKHQPLLFNLRTMLSSRSSTMFIVFIF